MKTEVAYCSGCGHQVRLVFTEPPPHDGHASLPEGTEIVCLESCSGGKCPTTGTPGIVMGVRLAKSHLNDASFKTIRARCEACGQISDLEVLDDTYALCTLCNTTNRWVILKLSDGSEIAVAGG
jgi:hypothetical protein